MGEIEKYLNKLTNTEQLFFKRHISQMKQGAIDFKDLHDLLKATVNNFEQQEPLQKLKHFLHLWTVEAELSTIIEEEKNGHSNIDTCYRNGRTRSIADTEELIYKLENKEV